MESHEPWLADFVSSSLADYVQSRQTGVPLLKYDCRTDAENLRLSQKSPSTRIVHVSEVL